GFEDDDGCPDQLPADVVAALATPVKFESRRARVTPAAGAALRPLITMLEAHPSIRLTIVGIPEHARRPADADLARRRADAVKWYLVDQGIVEDRLVVQLGEPKPRTSLGFALVTDASAEAPPAVYPAAAPAPATKP
ncbi:MAG TPA: OmpA family protein, partial [Kofleriaceae bacterium]